MCDSDSEYEIQDGEGPPLASIAMFLEKQLSGELGTKIKRKIFGDPLQEVGENHIPQIVDGSIELGNFAGPGTKIVKRLKRGDKPKTLTDKISKSHDLKYNLATTIDHVRLADEKMLKDTLEAIREIKEGRKPKKAKNLPYSRLNLGIASKGIKTKIRLEDKGKLARDKFAPNDDVAEEDKPLLKKELDDLEQEGFGVGGRIKIFKRTGREFKIPVEGLLKKMSSKLVPMNNKVFADFFPRYIDILRKSGAIPKGSRRLSKKKILNLIDTEMKGSGIKDIPVKVVELFVRLLEKMIKRKLDEKRGGGIKRDLTKMILRTAKRGKPSFIRGFASKY